MDKYQKNSIVRIILSSVLVLILKVVEHRTTVFSDIIIRVVFYAVPCLIVGLEIFKRAIEGIREKNPLDESFLMSIAVIGAFILGDYFEGTMVMLFYRIGELFEDVASSKNREHIISLMDIRQDYANIEDKDGNLIRQSPDKVNIGDIIIVKPGEKIPIDGMVVDGLAELNTVALTGESLPRLVEAGDEVFSGMIDMNSVIKVKTTKTFENSTASKILDLIENSSNNKSNAENFITKFARAYTPFVCTLSILIIVVPTIIHIILGESLNLAGNFYKALTFLVISCPCAILLSVPLCFFSTLGRASKSGVLIKGSSYVEGLSKLKTIFFDKTGTLTNGVLTVKKIECIGKEYTNEDILYYTACCESLSNHPIAKSIVSEYEKKLDSGKISRTIDKSQIKDFVEESGIGIHAKVDGKAVSVGNKKILSKTNISYDENIESGTIIYCIIDNNLYGYIVLGDEVKPQSKKELEKLKTLGIGNLIMLTGDNDTVAKQVSGELKISKYYSSLLPADKVKIVDEYKLAVNDKEIIGFVGDGINDAPVLARVDIGIAMGALGSDSAIEASDVVLMDDNPSGIAISIRLARKCMQVVYQNIIFAIAIKLLCIVLSGLGVVGMNAAVFADVGVMILSVLNAMRLML